MGTDLQTKLDSLDKLRELCENTEKSIIGYQDDSNLVKFLENEYPKTSKTVIKNIQKLLKGKKDSSKIVGDEKKTMENQLIAQSFLNDVNPIDNKGKFVGYTKLRHRIAQKKSGYNK